MWIKSLQIGVRLPHTWVQELEALAQTLRVRWDFTAVDNRLLNETVPPVKTWWSLQVKVCGRFGKISSQIVGVVVEDFK